MPKQLAQFIHTLNFAQEPGATMTPGDIQVTIVTKIASIIIVVCLFLAALVVAVYYYVVLHSSGLPTVVNGILFLVGGWALQNIGLSAATTLFQSAVKTTAAVTTPAPGTTTTTTIQTPAVQVTTPAVQVSSPNTAITASNKPTA